MKPFPSYKQLDSFDCGPTCLRMIAKYYGRSYTLQTLREKSYITRVGVSLKGISEAAESIGFRTVGAKLTFKQLAENEIGPCILHWNQNHFVVCYGIKKKRDGHYNIMISDPCGEKYTLTEDAFLKSWISGKIKDEDIGIALLLEPTPDFYAQEDDKRLLKSSLTHFFQYILPYKSQVFQLVAGMLIGSGLALLLPFLTQAMVDQGIGNSNLSLVTLVLIAQLVLFTTQLAVEYIRNWITLHMNARISISLISDFLSRLMKLPLYFFDTKNVGDILQRIGDNDRIRSFLSGSSLTILFSIGNFIIFSVILGFYDWLILIIFAIGNFLYVTWIILFLKYRRKLDIIRFEQSALEQSNLVQIVTGMQDIKLNNYERQQRWKWERIQVKLFNINIKSLALGQYQQLGSVFFSQTTYLLISFIAARAVIQGNMTLGMMMSISYIIGQLSGPIGQVISFVQSAQDAKISLERINEIQGKENEDENIDLKVQEFPSDKTISINGLYFNYDGAEKDYILNDINLTVPENKVTAIVGASGSGKTTLIKLILGFYTPNKGSIKIGNTPLYDINPHLWREKLGVVMQEGFIYSDTIANNIATGDDNIDKERLYQASVIANIHEFIESLPLKYNTKIGMEGNGISQGQRQRILIARAVYKNPEFFLLDEATNALDANNERIILENLNNFYKGKTVVIVAHRLSTVQNAHKIVVLDKGRIAEEGTHSKLIAQKSLYYELVKNQLELGS